jgi:glutaminyl-tRNA synthetase
MREVLNERAERRIAVLDPVKLVIDNYPEDGEEACEAPNHPQRPELGRRPLPFTRELWIEREDFTETPPKGYFRLFPGNKVRLRYGYVVECTGCDKDAAGNVIAVHCTYDPLTKSGTPGAEKTKVKGNLHWVSTKHACAAQVRLYDRLFKAAQPGRGSPQEEAEREGGVDESWIADLNPNAQKVITAQLEPALKHALPEARFQFERHGYFVADRTASTPGAPVFNRTVTLRDPWGKQAVETPRPKQAARR